jgi:hypothetical protein
MLRRARRGSLWQQLSDRLLDLEVMLKRVREASAHGAPEAAMLEAAD